MNNLDHYECDGQLCFYDIDMNIIEEQPKKKNKNRKREKSGTKTDS